MELRDRLQGTLGTAYSLENELGGGGMSRVFVATETSLGRSVVVKVLPPEFAVNVERFRREIRLAARLQHPHIVPVLAAGETAGIPFYTMPLVEGQSLRARLIESGALPMVEAVEVLADVAKALAYAHEHGVVHRDIKPDNVLLSGGAAMVTDFGIAKAISESAVTAVGTTLTSVGMSVGTPAYMAPEQVAADPATDHRADIYAFGCLAYEVLVGQPPFTGMTPQKLIAAQMGTKPVPVTELRTDIPSALASLVMRCLEKDPDARPQSAGELVQVLEMLSTTTSAERSTLPVEMLVPVVLGKAIMIYVVTVIAALLITRAAITTIGLPDWVLPGAVILMALGLPVVLFTAWVHYATHRAATEVPTLTPRTTSSSRAALAAFAERAGPHVSWGRTAKGGLATLVAYVLLVSAFMALRALDMR
jgi:serine/threonine protein kinase